MKEWEAFNALKKKIDDFNETCPLLEMMANKAMLERHWKRMEDLTGHEFDVESESFQLRNIMEAPLLKFREDIEVRVYRMINLIIGNTVEPVPMVTSINRSPPYCGHFLMPQIAIIHVL